MKTNSTINELPGRQWAEQQGYPYCAVLDWTSSAGDWSFIISKDNDVWYIMTQTNNWPLAGFNREIDFDHPYFGTSDEVLQIITSEDNDE